MEVGYKINEIALFLARLAHCLKFWPAELFWSIFCPLVKKVGHPWRTPKWEFISKIGHFAYPLK
jgi:hypothetical protein